MWGVMCPETWSHVVIEILVEREANITPCNTNDEQKARMTAVFFSFKRKLSKRLAGDFEVF